MSINVYLTPSMTNQRISHTWMTKIQENIQGSEKRSALFTWPRIKLESSFYLTKKERRFIYTHLWRDIHNIWGVPIITDRTTLTAVASAGQKILAVGETDYRHFYNGRECILINPTVWESYEDCTIVTVDSSIQITLADNLVGSWPIGTYVYPLYECRIESEQERIAKHISMNIINIFAVESFESTRSFSYTLPTIDTDVYPTYNAKSLFLNKPMNPISEKYRHPYTLLGFLGKQILFTNYGDTRGIYERTFLLTSKKEIYDLLNFFDAQQGRLKTFYTPSWMEDIIISAGFDAADTILTVETLYLISDEIIGRHIYIQFPDNSYACRAITARPSNTSITIDSAIGTTVSDVSNMLCCFLPEVRFNVDEIAFDYTARQTLAKTKLSFNLL